MSERGVFEELFSALEKNPAPRWIFGERLSLGGKEAVPVSEFRLVVELPRPGAIEGQAPGSGAALRMDGRPVGFLTESDGRIVFVPIVAGGAEGGVDDTPGWVDDLFCKLDDVRASCASRSRVAADDERDGRCRSRRDLDDEPRDRRPRRDVDGRD
jgi:hypothetical protein